MLKNIKLIGNPFTTTICYITACTNQVGEVWNPLHPPPQQKH